MTTESKRAQDRDRLRRSLANQVAGDPRISAAWLFGSFGRGDADCWSDLDVVIVAEEDQFDAVLAERYDQVAKLGEVVLVVESSYNGPPGGCYLMTGYDSPTGLLLIDWYWQPERIAQMANTNAVLANRASLPMNDDPALAQIAMWQQPDNEKPLPLWNPTEAEDRANWTARGWAMLAIQAKYIARKPDEEGLGFQEFIETLIAKASGNEKDPKRFGDPSELKTAEARLNRLEAIAAELGSSVPVSASPAEPFRRFLQTVESYCRSTAAF
jgi:predicted nucleotidyltransferase